MKRKISVFMVLCLLCTAFSSCVVSQKAAPVSENKGTTKANLDTAGEILYADDEVYAKEEIHTIQEIYSDEEMFTKRDCRTDYEEQNAILIDLQETCAFANNPSVQISGTTVTITEEATYIISGSLQDGMIIVDAPDTAKLQLVLKDVEIGSSTSAALYVKEADKVFVTLVGNNSLSSGESFVAVDDNNIDATIFSKQDITFNGEGSLTITSPAGHGIVCKDDLVLTGGDYTITSASHGIQANDSVRIKDATIFIDSGKDGIHAENSDDDNLGFVYIGSGNIQVESEGDSISSGSDTQIADGTFTILAGGGYENGTKASSEGFGMFVGKGPLGDKGPFGGNEEFDGKGPFGGNMPQMPEDMSQIPEDGPMKGGKHEGEGEEWTSMPSTVDGSKEDSTSMKGIKAGGNMRILGGTFTIDSADDAIHSNLSATINGGTFEIASGDDAIHAEETLSVTNGTINITDCYEGLEALHVVVSGGDISLMATDDGLNAAGGTDNSGMGGRDKMFAGSNSNGSIVVSGGTLYIKASGDGMDANGTLEISGGQITVEGPVVGDTATLDYDTSGIITGGTFIGTGATFMAQTFSSSKQGVLTLSAGSQDAGEEIVVTDDEGKEIISHTPQLPYQIVIISTPDIKTGETYTITIGTVSKELQAS